jgi:hypothetical protein
MKIKRVTAVPLALAFAFTLVVVALPLSAADHMNLEEGLPLQMEDAYPIAYRGREVQGIFRYGRTRDDKDRFTLAPQLEFGIFPNTELRMQAPFYVGNADRTGSGDIHVAGLYNFNTETIYLPALAVDAEGVIPTGEHNNGFDTTLKLIATKSISSGTDRIHANLAWDRNAAALEDEREHRYRAIIGYSRRISADWVILADFVRALERKEHEDSNVLELGFRWQVTPLSVISFGAGAGIGRESPLARAVIGFQKSF